MALYLWITLGSALGGLARFIVSGFVAERIGETFPWGTLTVNVAGSFLIGLFATLTSPDGRVFVGPHARQFVMTGFFGGFTTFSSFSLQTLMLAQDGEWWRAGLNVGGNVTFCLLAVWLGHLTATWINTLKGS
ncbi:fluoride efflux transporter CrcB [Horticoccus luteus]|uniref:Fluoride-specific ion channel FluC n=1 Tax=Horticoccus luteus TaxID=2862869 RepID=A0A8F9XFD1_9BACT|nr:fluoride efflux transporter CrcB [Horticoccus luteus]QYM77962.1 fluoride efflux transporter CrcB [Horticoccus luteus]